MPKSTTILPAAFLLLAACRSSPPPAAPASTRPYTVSKETTIVDGPLNQDGTINYTQAINDRLSEGVTAHNNAAIPLLQATANANDREINLRGLHELHA